MAKNEKSSKKLATIAADVLSGGWDQGHNYDGLLKITYALAASVLTQAPDKPKKKAATKGKKK